MRSRWGFLAINPAEELASGVSWTDTLTFSVEPADGALEMLEGIWKHEVRGDTVLDDRSLPWVRTTAEVRHRWVETVPDAGMEGNLRVERRTSGTLVGGAALDGELGLRIVGADTASWEGTAILHTQDGRSFEAPVSYERFRRWALSDSTEWAVAQDSLGAEWQRGRTGMLILPATELQERLVGGDETLADSLRTVWREADDPDQRAAVESLLRYWAARGLGDREGIDAWIEEARLELGDSATVLAGRLTGGSRLHSLTEEELDELLPYLDDLGRMWQLGVNPRWTYSTLARGLLGDTPILEPDTTEWKCAPAACERMIGLFRSTGSRPRGCGSGRHLAGCLR